MSPKEERRRMPTGELDWRETLFTMLSDVDEKLDGFMNKLSAIEGSMPQTDGKPDFFKHRLHHQTDEEFSKGFRFVKSKIMNILLWVLALGGVHLLFSGKLEPLLVSAFKLAAGG